MGRTVRTMQITVEVPVDPEDELVETVHIAQTIISGFSSWIMLRSKDAVAEGRLQQGELIGPVLDPGTVTAEWVGEPREDPRTWREVIQGMRDSSALRLQDILELEVRRAPRRGRA